MDDTVWLWVPGWVFWLRGIVWRHMLRENHLQSVQLEFSEREIRWKWNGNDWLARHDVRASDRVRLKQAREVEGVR